MVRWFSVVMLSAHPRSTKLESWIRFSFSHGYRIQDSCVSRYLSQYLQYAYLEPRFVFTTINYQKSRLQAIYLFRAKWEVDDRRMSGVYRGFARRNMTRCDHVTLSLFSASFTQTHRSLVSLCLFYLSVFLNFRSRILTQVVFSLRFHSTSHSHSENVRQCRNSVRDYGQQY